MKGEAGEPWGRSQVVGKHLRWGLTVWGIQAMWGNAHGTALGRVHPKEEQADN